MEMETFLTETAIETLRIERRLTPSQAERRDRLREAAHDLASAGGYAAVTIRSVAERAGVGPATVYRYFSSKDHLIAEVHAAESRRMIAGLALDPPSGSNDRERLQAVFDRMLESTARDLNLAAAGVSAITSGDPAANAPEYWQRMVMSPYLEVALGSDESSDRRELGEILGHLFFSLMIAMTGGRMSLERAKEIMRRTVELVVGARAVREDQS